MIRSIRPFLVMSQATTATGESNLPITYFSHAQGKSACGRIADGMHLRPVGSAATALSPPTAMGLSKNSITPETRSDLRSCKRVFRHVPRAFLRDDSWDPIFFTEVERFHPVAMGTIVFDDRAAERWYRKFCSHVYSAVGMDWHFPGAESLCRRVTGGGYLGASIYKRQKPRQLGLSRRLIVNAPHFRLGQSVSH